MHREPSSSPRLLEGYRVFAACPMSPLVMVVERVGASWVFWSPRYSPTRSPPPINTITVHPPLMPRHLWCVQKHGGVWLDDRSINR